MNAPKKRKAKDDCSQDSPWRTVGGIMKAPKAVWVVEAGKWLYASCSAVYFRVLSVGTDANGNDCLSIEVEDINEFLDDGEESMSGKPNLMYANPGTTVLHDVPWKRVQGHDDMVELRTPGTGCSRCTKLFFIKDSKP